MDEQEKKSTMTNKFSDIKIGLIARSDHSGLGYQTKAIADLIEPTKVLLIDSTPFNGRAQNYHWYNNPIISMGFPEESTVRQFLEGIDVAISCEIFYHDMFVDIAKEYGVKTILQPNPELNPYMYKRYLTKPDAFFLPSVWYKNTLSKMCSTYVCPPPITVEKTPRNIVKKRGKLEVLHVAGRRAYMDRNGTGIVEEVRGLHIQGVNVTVHDQTVSPIDDPSKIYQSNYDIVLLPRKYGGLSMPMYESLANGLPVLMPALSPNADILPTQWMLPVSSYMTFTTKSKVRGGLVNSASIVPVLSTFRDMSHVEYQHQVNIAYSIFDSYITGLGNWHKYIHEVVYIG